MARRLDLHDWDDLPGTAERHDLAALELRPNDKRTRHNLANLYNARAIELAQVGKPNEAYQLFRRAIETDPTHAESHANLATLQSSGLGTSGLSSSLLQNLGGTLS